MNQRQHDIRAAIDDLTFCAFHCAWALEHAADTSAETVAIANQSYIDARRALDAIMNTIAEPDRK